MRLIDAEHFICRFVSLCETDTDIVIAKIVCDALIGEPTAYDIDKVVEELDKSSDYYECEEQGREHVQMVDLTEAIEIVKQGGVSDDVCEWKQDNMCEKVYRVCGGCFTSAYQKDFKFCPYCGKKIKVVE